MQPDQHPIFAKFHSELVVGMLDIVRSTEITMSLSGDQIDDFYATFLQETSAILHSHGAIVIKNIGDGILFYFPKTFKKDAESFAEVIECANALLAGRARINEKLSSEHLPTIEYRVSFSFGAVSAMLGSDGSIIDLFGSVINTCTKMNKMAKPNTCIAGEALHTKLLELGLAGADDFGEKIGDYKIGDKMSFGVWEIAR